MSKKKMIRKIVQCPVCNTQTFNTVDKCKCGYKFPYDPIQDEMVVDICCNCGQIKQNRRGNHIGGAYTICQFCKKGELATLDTLDKWSKRSEEEKQKIISMVYTKKSDDSHLCKPKCPTCQSTNLRKISTTSKAINTVAFGLLGTKRNKTFHCNNCGYEW